MRDESSVPLGYCQCGCGEPTKMGKHQQNRYVHGHNWRGVDRKTTPKYLEQEAGYDTPCWIWQRARHLGYPRDGGRHAHREIYTEMRGPIPPGHHLHHLCRVPACVNPDHLRPVSPSEHARLEGAATKTHCPQGHAYDERNTYYDKLGYRHCRRCRADSELRRKARLRAAEK